jgi:hypothetical protein
MKMKRGCKGVDYGGKPHLLLDTMKILDSNWSKNNRYAREDGIQNAGGKQRFSQRICKTS